MGWPRIAAGGGGGRVAGALGHGRFGVRRGGAGGGALVGFFLVGFDLGRSLALRSPREGDGDGGLR